MTRWIPTADLSLWTSRPGIQITLPCVRNSLRHMYVSGTTDGCQEEYSTTLIGFGLLQGESCPNVFWHLEKDVRSSVHWDDFTLTGSKKALDLFEAEVAKQNEITISLRIRPGPGDAKKGRSLNRVIRCCERSVQ